MIAGIAQNLAPLMFVGLIVFLLLGYPVAFSLAACGLLFFVIGVELAPLSNGTLHVSWPLLQSLPERVFSIMNNETLLAIPFFTLMGMMLQRSGMAEDLLETIGQLFGTVRGGLAYAVIFVGALLAATTGMVAASVISMGLISLPIMLRYGYDRRMAAGVIAASGTLAQIIPPSLVLIVLADQLNRSVGDMYAGAFLPGLLLALSYGLYVFGVSFYRNDVAPGLPAEAVRFREPSGRRGLGSLGVLAAVSGAIGTLALWHSSYRGSDFVFLALVVSVAIASTLAWLDQRYEQFAQKRFLSAAATEVTFVMLPPLLLIFVVLGTIFLGVATPVEGGAMGAAGAILLSALKRWSEDDPKRFNVELLRSAIEATAKLSCFAIFILIGARIFSLAFYAIDGHLWIEHLFNALPGGQVGFLLAVNALIFVLAFFLEFFELAFIIVPLVGPIAEKLNIDLIWFGVILGVNVQTSFMHPPFGYSLFYLRSIAPQEPYVDTVTGRLTPPLTTSQIYWGAVPFVIIQLIVVCLIIFFPGLILHQRHLGHP